MRVRPELLRPDGSYDKHGFMLTELNFGNGTLVSNAYTETLYRLHSTDPVAVKLGLDESHLKRPFLSFVEMLQSVVASEEPLIGLLARSSDYTDICSWEKRVHDQIVFARRDMEKRGWRTILLHESDVILDGEGFFRTGGSQERSDMLLQITIGTAFADEPERLDGDFSWTRGNKTPFLKPLSALCFEKAVLPWLTEFADWPLESERFSVDVAKTVFQGSPGCKRLII